MLSYCKFCPTQPNSVTIVENITVHMTKFWGLQFTDLRGPHLDLDILTKHVCVSLGAPVWNDYSLPEAALLAR